MREEKSRSSSNATASTWCPSRRWVTVPLPSLRGSPSQHPHSRFGAKAAVPLTLIASPAAPQVVALSSQKAGSAPPGPVS